MFNKENQKLKIKMTKLKSQKLLTIIIVLILIIFCWLLLFEKNNLMSEKKLNYQTTQIKIGNQIITAEIADTKEKRELGLSGRQFLPAGTSMLFIFDQPNYHSFWMKNMNFPIDIIWLDANKKIIDLSENLSPLSFPKTFSPKTPAQFVLEVPANFIRRNQLQIGTDISF
ncbi:MAG: DUF192 domain-containing protein [Candidatus Vogelbacteria bacterium]|nr:DUF192 domain-containing protein [Candidatus Vogelbacteria bacterium]